MTDKLFMMPEALDPILASLLLALVLIILAIISIKLIFCNNLLEIIIFSSVFSLLISLSYLLMDAPDVAMTEVALGACLSSCVLLSFLRRLPKSQIADQQITIANLSEFNVKTATSDFSKSRSINYRVIISSVICLVFIIVFSFAGYDLPEYGSMDSPIQNHLNKYYLENTKSDIGIPSFIAALLASYRGYDTLGETAVILIAGISVLLLFSQKDNNNA